MLPLYLFKSNFAIRSGNVSLDKSWATSFFSFRSLGSNRG